MSSRFADKLLGATFGIELALPGGKVPANELLNLSVGKILLLGVSVRTPAVLKIDGHDSFQAVPVRSGNHRGRATAGSSATNSARNGEHNMSRNPIELFVEAFPAQPRRRFTEDFRGVGHHRR